VTTHTLLKDFIFLNNSNLYIVVFTPKILVMVLYKREVVTAFSTAVMDTDSMQIVRLVLEIFKHLSQVIILLLNLGLKRYYLMLCFVCVGSKV